VKESKVWSIAAWAFCSVDILPSTAATPSLPWSADSGLRLGPISYDATTVAA
jgi:hypothetical protein